MEDANRPAASRDLVRYQEALPVRLIETPRRHFVVCKPDETLGAVRARNTRDAFDHLPVENDGGHVIGVLDTAASDRCPDATRVRDCCVPIDESLLMGAEVSILEFLQDTDRRPFRFLVTKDRIGGLVSLSDIQRLPVRAALFAIITQFEMAMARLIDCRFPEDAWMLLLPPKRQTQIESHWSAAAGTRNQVARLLYTQFADKTAIVRQIARERGNSSSQTRIKAQFRKFEELRNALAHANVFGVTRDDAAAIVQSVRELRSWTSWVEHALQELENHNQ